VRMGWGWGLNSLPCHSLVVTHYPLTRNEREREKARERERERERESNSFGIQPSENTYHSTVCAISVCLCHIVHCVVQQAGWVPLYSSFESFYNRNIYRLIRDCWNRPICSAPAAEFDLMERVTNDHGLTFV